MTVLRSGSATDVGRVRKINQDLPLESTNLYAVADGMGGHVGGEVAAQVAVDALQLGFSREPTRAGLERAFAAANQAVWEQSQEHSELRGMGTTLTAVALVGGDDGRDTLALANVGDSRAYLFSEGQLVQVTADHSLAEERMRHGEITEEEAAVHPQRHILTRALGISDGVEADLWELHLRSGDRLVLCSDGLSNELSAEEIASVLEAMSDPGDAARRLVELANEHGGSDNITVIVVDVLVGEDSHPNGSVIAPMGARAGGPLIVTHGSPPGPAGAAPATDVLAKGAQLGFAGSMGTLSDDGPTSGEFFLDNTRAVPVARATVRSVVTPPPTVAPAPPDESRRERRRRLGVQRRITVRVILFTLLVAAIPVGAFFAIRWYAYDNWFLTVQHNEIVIQQGHPGGVLWFHPRVVDHTGIRTSELPSSGVSQIRAGVQEPSLDAAKSYVANLESEHAASVKAEKAKATPGATGTTGATGTPGAASSVPPTTPTTSTIGSTTTAPAPSAP
ncbi:MAG: Stp1/IreP family PP2C-type Ser/Thr phosphatase [Acidimicrobiales bacterium]